MDELRRIVVFGELEQDHLSSATLELLTISNHLSKKLESEVALVLCGSGVSEGYLAEGYGYGAHKVYYASDPLLCDYSPDAYVQAMKQVAAESKPAVILFPQTDKALDLAPRLACAIRASVSLDCVGIHVDLNSVVKLIKPVYGGKAHAVIGSKTECVIASIRQGSAPVMHYDHTKTGEVTPINLTIDQSRIRVKFVRKLQEEGLTLAAALTSSPVVISGGRGLKRAEGVDLLKETAVLLGGAVAGSRPAVDKGWLPSQLQVGLTGKRVNPHLYIAVGISGSLQHMAGCMKSKTIVAINTDDEAPIFKMAHIGVVGDYKEVLEGFNEEWKQGGVNA
jgi:electron transfer flavoprotein alpha subunit